MPDSDAKDRPVNFAEFFAGIGLVREALEPLNFNATWANDIEKLKFDQYAANHSADHFVLGDVRSVRGDSLPGGLDLATSSFPCIDVSLAGNRKGLAGEHSGMFWEFSRVIEELGDRRPRVVLLENVPGFASSHGGSDIRKALSRLNDLGYSCDVFAVDARHFVPQSRLRMFVVGIRGSDSEALLRGIPPISDTRPTWIQKIHQVNRDLNLHYREIPLLPDGPKDLSEVVEHMSPEDSHWWGEDRKAAFIASLSAVQDARFRKLLDSDRITWRTAYRRTRNGSPVWEIRRDSISGCLRTTGGGSSKQALVEVGNNEVRVRWMTSSEYARLMGAGNFKLHAATATQAQFGFGDAVVVDVIRWIGQHYLRPVLAPSESR